MRNILFTIVAILILSVASLAQEKSFKPMKDSKEFKAKYDQQIKEIKSIKSDFVQEKHLSFMDDSIVSKGIFRFKKENKIRLEYTTPFKYLMVLNNGKIYIKDGGKVSKFDSHSNKLFKQINDMLINTMNGNVLNSKDYSVVYYENESTYLVELTPLDKTVGEMIKKLKIFINKKTLAVSKVKIVEKSDDYTLISFINTQQNVDIKDEEFLVK